jgi:AcrR family transcriptional regulator
MVPSAADSSAPGFSPPKVRADAARNRDRLIGVARAAFLAGDGRVSLEGIARDAGVGVGTLYRHFPTREALVEAVYRTELAEVCARAEGLLADCGPADALRRWMDTYAAFVVTKRGLAESLRSVLQSGVIAAGETRQRVTETVAMLLDAGVAAGDFRADVQPGDVVATMVGIFLASPEMGDGEQVRRMLDLLDAGIRVC